jgi:hypothetical protein
VKEALVPTDLSSTVTGPQDSSWPTSLFFNVDETDDLIDENLLLYRDMELEIKEKKKIQKEIPRCSLSFLPPPSYKLVASQQANLYSPFEVSHRHTKEELISALVSIADYSIDIQTTLTLPTKLRQQSKFPRDDSSVILSVSNESIRGPLLFLGKGSFGYALRCFRCRDSQQLVLKIDTRYNYALWDAIVQAKVM